MQIFNRPSTRQKRKDLRKDETDAETALWQRLRGKRFMGCKFFRQYGIGEYIADFYCPQHKLAIEVDGSQHYSDDGSEYDTVRESYMISLTIKTIRFGNRDVLENMAGVLSRIERELNSPIPLFSKEGEATKEQGELVPYKSDSVQNSTKKRTISHEGTKTRRMNVVGGGCYKFNASVSLWPLIGSGSPRRSVTKEGYAGLG